MIDGTEALRFVATGEIERDIGDAFPDGLARAKTLEAFASAGSDGEQTPLIRCALAGTADAIRNMEATARNFAIQEQFEKLRAERSRRSADRRVSGCREKVQLSLTKLRWDYQDDVKACSADEACIRTAKARWDARAAPRQQELAACDSLGGR